MVNNMEERTEGWGNVENARDAHYFRDGMSLCNRWAVFGGPRWERHQELGKEPTRGSGTCKACWKKRAKEEGVTPNAALTGERTETK